MRMKKFTYQISLFLWLFQVMTSCVTYKDFPISTDINYKPDYSDPFVQSQFQRGKVYRIWMDDNKRVIDFKLYEVREDRLVGVYAKNNFEKTGIPAKT
ncbi:hypothetical protein EF405_07405 [Cyclobacteriaceae bacterium YHN15]|nr:hypothetical protein EF405_07405 [Cyclobacteriaceae bacterium YHN15]